MARLASRRDAPPVACCHDESPKRKRGVRVIAPHTSVAREHRGRPPGHDQHVGALVAQPPDEGGEVLVCGSRRVGGDGLVALEQIDVPRDLPVEPRVLVAAAEVVPVEGDQLQTPVIVGRGGRARSAAPGGP